MVEFKCLAHIGIGIVGFPWYLGARYLYLKAESTASVVQGQ